MTNAAELEDLRDLIAARIGLMLDAGKLDQLETVLAARSRATGATPRHYVDAVAPTQAELSQIMRMLAVSETYFFRNAAHFRVLEELIARRRGSTIRILSAGCSSGEEPYTIAMIAREVLGERDAGSVSILGVDLNPDAIAKARAAVYTPWSLRETPGAFAQKFFRTVGSEHRLIDEVERMVRFEEQNLLDPMSRTFHRESCDAIFCRNVLMYLKPSSAAELVSTISRALVPGGLLFLGHAENLRGLSTDFHLRHSHDAFYYERKDALSNERAEQRTSIAPEPADVSWYQAIVRSAQRVEQLTGARKRPLPEPAVAVLGPALALMQAEKFQDALALLPGGGSRVDPDLMLMRAALLLVSGDVAGAETAAHDLLAIDELNAGAHYIMALCCEHAGDLREAIDHDLTALYLDPDFAMPRLHRGLLARRSNDRATARRELEQALALLVKEDAFRIVLFGGGFGREGLMQLCRSEIEACRGEP